jgi:hypothetical protein
MTPLWRPRNRSSPPRQKILIPAHYLRYVRHYAMETWFTAHCPGREYLLSLVQDFYNKIIFAGPERDHVNINIREADTADLELLAGMLAQIVTKEQSLLEWIDMNNKTVRRLRKRITGQTSRSDVLVPPKGASSQVIDYSVKVHGSIPPVPPCRANA